MKSSKTPADQSTLIQELQERLEKLEESQRLLQERERRALADYQNLVKRTQSDKAIVAKVATQALVEDLLEPLSHLSLAAEQLNDPGLDMVLKRLWDTLHSHGLQEIEVLGKKFDVQTMEAVEVDGGNEQQKQKVVKIVRPGYSLHGQIIQHAKVVLGGK